MAARKKLLAGDGWSFEPAGATRDAADAPSLPPDKQRVTVKVEKRPKGKVATVIAGFVLSAADRKALAKELKNACGSGGGDSAGLIEIQGDHREKIAARLSELGWKASVV